MPDQFEMSESMGVFVATIDSLSLSPRDDDDDLEDEDDDFVDLDDDLDGSDDDEDDRPGRPFDES